MPPIVRPPSPAEQRATASASALDVRLPFSFLVRYWKAGVAGWGCRLCRSSSAPLIGECFGGSEWDHGVAPAGPPMG